MINSISDFSQKPSTKTFTETPSANKILVSTENLLPDKARAAAVSYIDLIPSSTTFFGLRKYCHPKMSKFTEYYVNGIAHVKVFQTLEKLQKMAEVFQKIRKNNQTILFVATKPALRSTINELVSQTPHLFATFRWPGGLLTNYEELLKRIQALKKTRRFVEEGRTKQLTKREQMIFFKKKYRLEKTWQGMIEFQKLPDYLFIIDPLVEKIAISEAQKMKIPVLAITKNSFNPDYFEHFIPTNDNSITVAEIFVRFLLTTWKTEEIPPISWPTKTDETTSSIIKKVEIIKTFKNENNE